jgi:hypothetical protein
MSESGERFWRAMLGRMADASSLYLLWHGDDVTEGSPEPKLLGVYSSETVAKERIERTLRQGVSGFAEHPDDFHIDMYQLDKDEWVEGYWKIDPEEWMKGQDGST